MISVLVDRVKKLQDLVNRLNKFNKFICDSNHQLQEKASFLHEDNCEKESCVANQFQNNERLKDEYERINGVAMPIIAIECKQLEGLNGRSKEKRHKCDVNECEKKFKTKSLLKQHLISHSDARPFICDKDQCGKNFKYYSDLKCHQFGSHTDPSKYKYVCDFQGCAKRFYASSLLSIHKKTKHSDCRPYKCTHSGCNNKFKMIGARTAHLKYVHGKAYHTHSCPHEGCQFKTYHLFKLKRHMLKHTEGRPFKCTIDGCGKMYKYAESLKVHARLHSNKRRFKCSWNECDYASHYKSNLRLHERKHLNVTQRNVAKIHSD